MPKYNLKELRKFHNECIYNKDKIANSKDCGCFHCLKHFHVSELEYIDEDIGETAICPNCGIDSIIGSVSKKVDDKLLEEMNIRYFGYTNEKINKKYPTLTENEIEQIQKWKTMRKKINKITQSN